jgi:hypothetical protein
MFKIEETMVSWEEGLANAPEAAVEEARRLEDSCSVGFGKNDQFGWYVLATGGQGPIMIWAEAWL